MAKKLYVGNLLYEVTEDDLSAQFGQVGPVVSSSIIRYADSGRSKGFGFVEMENDDDAQKAIDQLNGTDYKGRKLVVSEARPPKPRTFDNNNGGNGAGEDRFAQRTADDFSGTTN